MLRLDANHPTVGSDGRLLPKAAVLSFMLGIVALRLCWLPGVNCVFSLAAIGLGSLALVRILGSHGRAAGLEEAMTGLVLGVVVLGLSTFFISALVAAYRH